MPAEITTLITIVGGVIAAAATYMFTKWREREAQWRKDKTEVYKEFVMSLSAIVALGDAPSSPEKKARFVHACNNLNLIAPQPVIEALKTYDDETKANSKCFEERISKVFYEMRKDLKISPKDDVRTFRVRVWLPPNVN